MPAGNLKQISCRAGERFGNESPLLTRICAMRYRRVHSIADFTKALSFMRVYKACMRCRVYFAVAK
jgi:hypothetical protein